jgi:hypothetical protein
LFKILKHSIAIGLHFGSYVPTVELNNTIQLFESNNIDELIQIIIQIFKLQFAFRLEYHCILLGIIGFKLCYPQKGEIKMNCQMKLFMTLRCILKTKPQRIHFPAANRNSTDSSYSHCCLQGVKLGFLAPFNDKILFNAKSFHNLTQKRTEDVNRKNSQHKLSYRYFFRNVKLEKKKTTQPNVNTDSDSEEDVAVSRYVCYLTPCHSLTLYIYAIAMYGNTQSGAPGPDV